MKEQHYEETPSGLKYRLITKNPSSAKAVIGKSVVVHYTGWLYEQGVRGKKFDSSRDRGEPFQFKLGAGQVIKGWDEGVALLRVGEKAEFLLPPQIAYGARGAGAVIPPHATLCFEVELLVSSV